MREAVSASNPPEIVTIAYAVTSAPLCYVLYQAIAALPDALREEARAPDTSILPIERKVFTETAPIPDFQAKLIRPAGPNE